MRIQRGEKPSWYDDAVSFNKGEIGNMSWAISKKKLDELKIHASEYSSVGLRYDFHLDNNDTLAELYRNVDLIINQLSDRPGAKSPLCA